MKRIKVNYDYNELSDDNKNKLKQKLEEIKRNRLITLERIKKDLGY